LAAIKIGARKIVKRVILYSASITLSVVITVLLGSGFQSLCGATGAEHRWICNAPNTNNFDMYIYPMLASLISALIFWIVLVRFPEERKKQYFNKSIKIDLQKLMSSMGTLLTLSFSAGGHHLFQNKIYNDELSTEEMRLLLKAKTHYQDYDPKFHPLNLNLEYIGDALIKARNESRELIERLYSLSMFMEPEHINLIRIAHSEIDKYAPYYEHARCFNGIYMAANPTSDSMAENLKKISSIRLKLENIIIDYYSDDSDYRDVAHYLWRGPNPKRFIKYFNRFRTQLEEDSGKKNMWLHLARANAMIGNQKKAKEWMQAYIEIETELVSGRRTLADIEKYEYLTDIMKSKFNNNAIQKYKLALERENSIKTAYIELCTEHDKKIEEYMNSGKK